MAKSYSMQGQESPSLAPALRVVITGGTAGLGLALVREFSRRGAAIAFLARGRERLELVTREIPGTHGIIGDLARKEDIHPVALQIIGGLGGLDVLVNNASSLGPVPLALLADTECEQLELALATNLVGPFRLTRALLGALSASARQGRGAAILNLSSDAAINPYPQ
jgi:NAD(P)-dependent dehydrogenase (short-subunit alcohol dehydrogenase family)